MELIVDANILLSAFLKEALTRELLLDSRLILFAPEYLLVETARHLKQTASLRKRIQSSGNVIEELFNILTSRIQSLPKKSYADRLSEALSLAPHREDAPYLAVALSLQIPIWSNDKGLKNQSQVKVYSTAELMKALEKQDS